MPKSHTDWINKCIQPSLHSRMSWKSHAYLLSHLYPPLTHLTEICFLPTAQLQEWTLRIILAWPPSTAYVLWWQAGHLYIQLSLICTSPTRTSFLAPDFIATLSHSHTCWTHPNPLHYCLLDHSCLPINGTLISQAIKLGISFCTLFIDFHPNTITKFCWVSSLV